MRFTLLATFIALLTIPASVAAENNAADAQPVKNATQPQPAEKQVVRELENGVTYEVINSGSGKTPTPGDRVEVHYHGTLLSGEVFDSSVERGKTSTFNVSRVIPGFSMALLKMKEGDKWRVTIPSEQAYGKQGAGKIGPDETLVFVIELIKVK
jgi:FKBP-type peptidyl-prolyl cis-trans isomerase FklB